MEDGRSFEGENNFVQIGKEANVVQKCILVLFTFVLADVWKCYQIFLFFIQFSCFFFFAYMQMKIPTYPFSCPIVQMFIFFNRRTDVNQTWIGGSLIPEDLVVLSPFQNTLSSCCKVGSVLKRSIPALSFLFFFCQTTPY